MSTSEEMIAHNRTTDEIAKELGTDTLAYISMEGVYEAVRGDRGKHCDACFSGNYPVAGTDTADGKFALETDAAIALPMAKA
jgi:amidophosphoribosyltransferase